MFMSNKVKSVKSDAQAQSASFLPRNTKSDVRDDIKSAVAEVSQRAAKRKAQVKATRKKTGHGMPRPDLAPNDG